LRRWRWWWIGGSAGDRDADAFADPNADAGPDGDDHQPERSDGLYMSDE